MHTHRPRGGVISEYTTPSQAEGERLPEDEDESQAREHHHPDTTRTTPSQAEGERATNDEP
ncbi:hypothetical protein AF335_17125 [Streptomyces eurocidicus]|uniref:Uncharacterized protein n=1 Tax=Streptomyces eurocidicus TaxID=66423 RepID=A0A2N8NU94_STREU|nr:hypothetical protein [Streptomyces eurocidicus]MBB5120180.1 hypothetical protein [Streptomyces eurocidicus]MBF6056134.1 hypothetical protein [Streptomyces eurocidicus]PNE32341.1 hypothetical protein AF335_17125 [Streptomyces eurocidicus]